MNFTFIGNFKHIDSHCQHMDSLFNSQMCFSQHCLGSSNQDTPHSLGHRVETKGLSHSRDLSAPADRYECSFQNRAKFFLSPAQYVYWPEGKHTSLSWLSQCIVLSCEAMAETVFPSLPSLRARFLETTPCLLEILVSPGVAELGRE